MSYFYTEGKHTIFKKKTICRATCMQDFFLLTMALRLTCYKNIRIKLKLTDLSSSDFVGKNVEKFHNFF